MIYLPLGEYSGTRAKFGPLDKSETCASVCSLPDKFFNHLALVGSGVALDGNIDGKLVGFAAAVLEVDVMMFDGVWLQQPLELL